jgi:hypothetical protein
MTAAPMTESERALWVQAKQDYTHALKIAEEAWPEGTDNLAIQAAAATILIHITKLRGEERLHVRVPPQAAPAAVKRDDTSPAPSQAPVAVPPCPQCGGEMWDNRGKKKNPKGADFTCKQKNGECVNDKGFKTGLWEKDLKKGNGRPNALAGRNDAASYEQPPVALADDGDGDLPF